MSRKRNPHPPKNGNPHPLPPVPQQTLPAPEPEKGITLTKPQAVTEILSALDGHSNAAAKERHIQRDRDRRHKVQMLWADNSAQETAKRCKQQFIFDL